MNPVEQLNLTIWSWIETFRTMRRAVFFVPFLFYLGVQAVLFALLWGFAQPAVSWFMAPFLTRMFGEAVIHYPYNFAAFPVFFARADLPMAVILGGLLFGASTWLFARAFNGEPLRPGNAFANARTRYLVLALSQVPGTVLGAAILYASEQATETGSMHGNMLRIARYGGLVAAIAVQALFAFAMAFIALEGVGLGRAIVGSMRLAARNAIGAFLLVAFPVALHYPALFIYRNEALLMQRGAPELIAVITAGDLLVGVVTNYLVLGAVTRFYLARRRPVAGGALS